MFPSGARLIQGINEVINISLEEKYGEVFKSAESRPKRENASAGIDRLVMSFDGKT